MLSFFFSDFGLHTRYQLYSAAVINYPICICVRGCSNTSTFHRIHTSSQYYRRGLCSVLLEKLRTLDLNVHDIRGQGYDNGANMRGVHSGVQKRLLEINNRAFFTPCACHSYNLVVADMAKTCPDALTFFGIVQRIYTLFSASTKRWSLFRENVEGLSVKPLCETRWECRIDSVKALRYQLPQVCDALDDLSKVADDPKIKSEAEFLYANLSQNTFIVSFVRGMI